MSATFDDGLEPLGLVVGVFLVLVGIGTIVGQPWAQMSNAAAAGGQVFGALMAIVVGVLLALFSRDGPLPF